jgi:hypothetical protein
VKYARPIARRRLLGASPHYRAFKAATAKG